MKDITHVSILGGGAWGTALAKIVAQTGRKVTLWAREAEVVASVNHQRENSLFLPSIRLPSSITAVGRLEDLRPEQLTLLAVPAQYMRGMVEKMVQACNLQGPVVIVTKGIEVSSGKWMSQIVEETCKHVPCAVLSGPSFAKEVAQGLPTCVALACAQKNLLPDIAACFTGDTFKLSTNTDMIGTQIGGVVKNVVAIACGMVMNEGQGARAVLLTKGFEEMRRLGQALGAKESSLTGVAGLGDLVLTAFSDLSRNTTFGKALARGESLGEIVKNRRTVAEGVGNAQALASLAHHHKISLPVITTVHGVIRQQIPIAKAIKTFLS